METSIVWDDYDRDDINIDIVSRSLKNKGKVTMKMKPTQIVSESRDVEEPHQKSIKSGKTNKIDQFGLNKNKVVTSWNEEAR